MHVRLLGRLVSDAAVLVGALILAGGVILEAVLLARGKKPGMSTITAGLAGLVLLLLIVRAIGS